MTVTVFVQGGLVDDVSIPEGVEIIVKDYDAEGIDAAEDRFKEDDNGTYVETVYGEGETKVIITVQGGVADVESAPEELEVLILDGDNS